MSMSDPRWVSVSDPRWVSVSEEKRNELLEKHRGVNVGYAWWDFLYEDFVTGLAEIGIDVDTKQRHGYAIYFSGFWSQGDGACFEGSVSDWSKLLTELDQVRFISHVNDWSFKCRSVGGYCHSNTMTFSGEMGFESNPFNEDDERLQYEAWALTHVSGKELNELWDRVEAKFKALADDLYEQLEREHDYQTDDEQVAAWILEHAADELAEGEEEEVEETA